MLAQWAMPGASFDSARASLTGAQHFGPTDRGAVAPGRRAGLLLINGDPVHDSGAVRSISRVWCGGIEHTAHLAKQK